MDKIFAIQMGSPENSIDLYFFGDESKTKEDFLEAIRLLLIDKIDNNKIDILTGLDYCFSSLEYDKDENGISTLEKNMDKYGFRSIKPDIVVSGYCWDRIGKKKKKYYLSPFWDTAGELGKYLLDHGFELSNKRI